jgi:hypothetical protein
MRQPKEDSLLFSLRELETMEAQRIVEDRRRREAADADRKQLLLDAERLERAEREQAESRERERRLAEERALREEQAHLDAIHAGELERVRAEVRARAELEMAEARRRSEAELEEARGLASRRRYRWVVGASAVTTCATGAIAGFLSTQLRAMQAADAARAAVVAVDLENCGRARANLDETRKRIDALERQLGPSRDTAVTPPPGLAPGETQAPAVKGHGTVKKRSGAVPHAPTCSGDGDPLNGCLPP